MVEPLIRIRASAAIVRDGHILLIECDDPTLGLHYNLPGGGVEPGEAMHDAVRREVWEETTAEVDVGPLLLVWEYRPNGTQLTNSPHSLGMMFRCTLCNGSEPAMPPMPDTHQIGLRWVSLAELHNVQLLPAVAEELIAALHSPLPDLFVGSVQGRLNA